MSVPVRSVLLAGLLVLPLGCGGVGKTVRRADDYMGSGRYAAAARTYTSALEKKPRDPELLASVARAWLAAGEPERALSPAELAHHADAPGGALLYAEALVATGSPDRARPLLDGAGADPASDAHAAFLLAEIRLAEGDTGGAVEAVELGLPRNRSPRGTAFAAWVHHRAGNTDRALDLARRASEHAEADAQVFAEASAVHLEAGRADLASTLASRARTLLREERDTWTAAAVRRQEAGDLEGAVRRTSWLWALEPQDGMYPLQLGELWVGLGKGERALQALSRARELQPYASLLERDADVQLLAASARLSDAERVAALTRLHLAEAEAWRLLGDRRRSLAARTEALAVQPSGGPGPEWIVVSQGWLDLEDYAASISAAERAVAQDPAAVPAYLLLLQSHAALGHIDQAVGYGRIAWSNRPGDANLALLLAQLHVHRGERREATKLLSAALAANPDDTRLSEKLAELEGGR